MKHITESILCNTFVKTIVAAATILGLSVPATVLAWEPDKPVEFIVPAGTGGGADQMARLIQGIVTKHNLMKQPMVVVNKSRRSPDSNKTI